MKTNIDFTIKIGGEAGQGLQTIGQLLVKTFARHGLYAFANQVLQSRVRGGHNWFQIRVSNEKILNPHPLTDILIALDQESSCHLKELKKDSITIFDSGSIKIGKGKGLLLDVPLARIASENGGNRIMANTVAVAVVLGLLEGPIAVLFDLLRESFGEKNVELAETNVKIAQAGFDHVHKKVKGNRLPSLSSFSGDKKMVVGGNEAVALGALAAGCQFMCAYPMSPSTGIMTYLASQQNDFHLVVEQSEDEIASINIALGASFAGARSMTASSGGGFALMAEGLSLAGMTETPIVIVLAQRPAPATGLPTRTAQEDLLFAIHAGHGEFPRMVMAPATIEEVFYATGRAFHVADKYRMPVIILSDQFLVDSLLTIDGLDPGKIKIDRNLMGDEELGKVKDFKSYLLTRSGVSPRALPGNPYCLVTADSDEHDETGRITEDVDVMRPAMVKKRNAKLSFLLKEMEPPKRYGPQDAKNFLVGWGSTFGVLREAVDMLNRRNRKVALVHFSEVWPLPEKHLKFLDRASFAAVVENNFTGQFADLIAAVSGRMIKSRINKFNGLPFMVQEIVREYEKLKKG